MFCSVNRFTRAIDADRQHIELRSDRPALLISSTSWTVDEDFGLLLDALVAYDKMATRQANGELPNVVAVITGRGPQKNMYLQKIDSLQLRCVQVRDSHGHSAIFCRSCARGWPPMTTHACFARRTLASAYTRARAAATCP